MINFKIIVFGIFDTTISNLRSIITYLISWKNNQKDRYHHRTHVTLFLMFVPLKFFSKIKKNHSIISYTIRIDIKLMTESNLTNALFYSAQKHHRLCYYTYTDSSIHMIFLGFPSIWCSIFFSYKLYLTMT